MEGLIARLPRYFVMDQPLYVIQRGNNRRQRRGVACPVNSASPCSSMMRLALRMV